MSEMATIQNDRFYARVETRGNRAVAVITPLERSDGKDAKSFAESMTEIQQRIIALVDQGSVPVSALRLVIETTMLVHVVAKIQPPQLSELKRILSLIDEIELFADDHKAMAKLMNLLITSFAGPMREKLQFHGTLESAIERAWQPV
jgi:hypothetical protein